MISLSQHLNNLLEHYLEPMKRETFLSNAEINALFGNIHEIVTFQRQFLQNLEEALELEPEFNKFEHCGQFRVSLMATNRVDVCVCESVCVTRLPIENLSLSTLYMLISFFFCHFPSTECAVCNWLRFSLLCQSLQALLLVLCQSQQGTEGSPPE